MILIIDQRTVSVSYESQTLCIRRDHEPMQRIPLNLLEQMIVYGKPNIDISVWRALSAAAIPACLLSLRGGQEPVVLASGLAKRLPLRRLQYRCAENKNHAHAIARWFLAQKFVSYDLSLNVLSEAQQNAFKQQRHTLTENLNQSQNIQAMMGLEGALAHAWFASLAETLPAQWRFSGRNRRPPQDPFNALLSLGYTLLTGEIRQILVSEGLDPAFGFLHQPAPGREALALDFTELFRSAVDFALYAFIEELTPQDFYYSQAHGCRLTKSARPLFYRFWAEFREQCPRYAGNSQAEENGKIVSAPLPEQIRGRVAVLRECMKSLEAEPSDD
ncbi:CRISPR-associated endonuclease Cas1 [Methylotuvimicrobium sp. KM2]|uniref:CRISPR-associated endonuclease Cas1 n=1 Tax=Methylotuvimicrobium sp. KM2 TaxID=3133976 RepID=UPI0031018A7B